MLMKKTILMIVLLLMCVVPVSASNLTIVCSDAPVASVLKTVFASTGANYSVDPSISGIITMSLHDVTFDVALKTVLTSCAPQLEAPLTDGVYYVKVKNTPTQSAQIPLVGVSVQSVIRSPEPTQLNLGMFETMKLNYIDPSSLKTIFSKEVVLSTQATRSNNGSNKPNTTNEAAVK